MTPDKRNGPAGNGTESNTQQSAGQAPPSVPPTPDVGRKARPPAERIEWTTNGRLSEDATLRLRRGGA